jgi:oligoribonuclease
MSVKKLFWIDLEMTGLDVEREVIIEVAALITDLDFNEVETYHSVVKQPSEFLERMDLWNKSHHGESGLTAAVSSGREPALVEKDLNELCQRHFESEPAILAGNSIAQDRAFINRYWPEFAKLLHYRMLDVTAWKILMNEKFGIRYAKKNAHRAIDDIRESLNEMKLYAAQVKSPQS